MRDMEWGKAIRNGLFAWLLSLLIFLAPVLVLALSLAEGQDRDLLGVGREVAEQVGALYAGNWLLIGALVFISAVIITWLARAVANWSGPWRLANGLLVGVVPAALWLALGLLGGFELRLAVIAAVYAAAGLLGGMLARP